LPPQFEDCAVLCWALDAAIGAVVDIRAVAVVLAVGFVVLALKADQIGERETVVHGDVVDARAWIAAAMFEQVGAAGHAEAEFADQAAFAGPIAAQRAPKAVVPFRPAGRKIAGTVAAGTEVPRLGDELHAGEDRVLPDGGEERRAGVK